MVLLGVKDGDDESDARYIGRIRFRVSGYFEDSDGKDESPKRCLRKDFGKYHNSLFWEMSEKAKRPSFSKAARPEEEARRLYRYFIDLLSEGDIEVQEGIFQAEMMVRILNDGPVTILLDSKNCFRRFKDEEVKH